MEIRDKKLKETTEIVEKLNKENKKFRSMLQKRDIELKETTNTIRKTCPCKAYPLIPHIYIAKLGYAGVYIFLLQNIDCGYALEPPRRGGSNVYPQSMF